MMERGSLRGAAAWIWALAGRYGYYAACGCLIAVAAALRFYDLSGDALWLDEAAVAVILRDANSFQKVLVETRYGTASPILYPVLLWLIQKIDSTAFIVRVIPAVASVLTVGSLALLLPRAGLGRWAAFTAAALAALSAEAIVQAQDAREYSLDTLAAALLIFGALWHIRGGGGWRRYAPICGALFVAPLVQYGVLVVCAAALGAVGWKALEGALAAGGDWRRRARRLALEAGLPAAALAAGCAVTWATTLEARWTQGFAKNKYLSSSYYSGDLFDVAAVGEFLFYRIGGLLEYHMPVAVVALAAAFAIFAARGAVRGWRRMDPVLLLVGFSLSGAAVAAWLGYYPLGGIRQCLYMGPVLFVGAGRALEWGARELGERARGAVAGRGWALGGGWALARRWGIGALGLVLTLVIAAGAMDLINENPYRESPESLKSVFAELDARKEAGDIVYLIGGAYIVSHFYKRDDPDVRYYHSRACRRHLSLSGCFADMPIWAKQSTGRLWIAGSHAIMPNFELLEELYPGVRVEHAVDRELADLYLIETHGTLESLSGPAAELEVKGELVISADFDVRLDGNRLMYARDSCVPSDVEARFFLHITPADASDLPEKYAKDGEDNFDFAFDNHGVAQGGRCVAVRELPDYDILKAQTGQFNGEGQIWAGEFRF